MSPDETAVVYDSDESGNGDIFRLELTTETFVNLTANPEVEMNPIFSPDGKGVVYARQSDGYQHIWIMKPDGSDQTQITEGQVIDNPTSFSEDGQTLFFVRTTYFGRLLLPKREMFSVSLHNTNRLVRRLGEFVAVSSDLTMAISNAYHMDTRESNLWLVTMNTSSTRFIGKGGAPSFSSGGEQILYLTQNPDYSHDVVVKELDSGKEQIVPFPRGYKFAPRFYRQGKAVIVRIPATERDGEGGVYIADLETFETKRIPKIPGGKLE